MNKLLSIILPVFTVALMPSLAIAGDLKSDDFVGVSFWIISIAMVASTVFFIVERDRVNAKWKTSLTVSALVTLIAAVHYFYMRDVWVETGQTPTVFRYIDWLLTVPLLMIEFYFILAAVTTVSAYAIDNIALTRKDCMVFLSPERSDALNNAAISLSDRSSSIYCTSEQPVLYCILTISFNTLLCP